LKRLDEEQRKKLLETDSSYRETHPELTLNAKTNLNDPEQRALVKELIEKREDKESEHEQLIDLKAKMEIIAEKQMEEKMNKLHVPNRLRDEFRANPEKLQGFEAGLKQIQPAGSAPLNEKQYGYQQNNNDPNTPLREKTFPDTETMIRYLRSQNTKEAEQALNRLWVSYIRGWREMGRPSTVYPPPDQPTGSGTPEVIMNAPQKGEEEDSEISKWGIKKSPQGYSRRKNADGSDKQ
jgi:hypothetical protein